jgi:hypothetical protein
VAAGFTPGYLWFTSSAVRLDPKDGTAREAATTQIEKDLALIVSTGILDTEIKKR